MNRDWVKDFLETVIGLTAIVFSIVSQTSIKWAQAIAGIIAFSCGMILLYRLWVKPRVIRRKIVRFEQKIRSIIHTYNSIEALKQAVNRIEFRLGIPLTTDEDMRIGMIPEVRKAINEVSSSCQEVKEK